MKKMSLQSLVISSLTLNIVIFKKGTVSNCVLSTNHALFMKFTTEKSSKSAFKLCDILECPNESCFKNQSSYLDEMTTR